MFRFLHLVTVALLFSSVANGAPLYYTFSGEVTRIFDDAGAVAQANSQTGTNITIGSSVEYIFLIDSDRQGERTSNSGGPPTVVGDVSTFIGDYNYFYTDLISGSLIDEVDGGSFNDPGSIAEYNSGVESNFFPGQPYTDRTTALGGSDNNTIEVGRDGLLAGWILNATGFFGNERAFDNSGIQSSSVISELTLTSISDSLSPVPLPPAIWLFGSAFLALLGFNKRKKAV